jgi:hypothetical protein
VCFWHLTLGLRRGWKPSPAGRAATRGRKVDCLARPRLAVPSAVSYEVRQQGNALSNALGHRTHSHPADATTVRERCICQHQAEMGLDGW